MDRCTAIEWAIDAGAPSAAASRVLITLARLSEDGVCSASQIEIARRSFLSERQTRTILKQLEAHEYALISRERRGGSGHGRHYDVYRLALPEQPEKAQPANIAAAFVEERATGNFLQNALEKPEQPAISVNFREATGNPCTQPANIAAASEATGNPPHTPQLLPSSETLSVGCSVELEATPVGAPAFELTPAVEKPKSHEAKKRGTRMSASWMPTNDDREFALSAGVPSHRVDGIADEFRDYWIGRGEARASWSATWRNNVRKFLERNPGVRNGAVILEHPNGSRTHHNQRSGNAGLGSGSGSGGSGSRPLSKAAMWAQIARQAQ